MSRDPSVYFEEADIVRMKSELREMNNFYEALPMTYLGHAPCKGDRILTRIFNVVEGMSEDEAGDDYAGFGRLYGAFWIGMKSEDRRNIRINGNPLAYLDFNAMNVHLGYFLAGNDPPSGDLYDLTNILCNYENIPEWRKPVKKFFGSMWFCRSRRMPDGIFFPKKEKTSPALRYDDVQQAILRKHRRLRSVLPGG